MFRKLLIAAFILLNFTEFTETKIEREYASLTSSIFGKIGRNLDILLNGLEEIVDDNVLASIKDVPGTSEYSEDCYGCQVGCFFFYICRYFFPL